MTDRARELWWRKRVQYLRRKVRRTGAQKDKDALARAEAALAKIRAGRAPRIITAAQAGINSRGRFGPLGPETRATIHYTAGPVDQTVNHALQLDRQYAAYHRQIFGDTIAYHFNICRDGTIICLRSTYSKGAHTAQTNSNNVGVMFHGTTGDKPSKAQAASLRWLAANAHTKAMPATHRCDRDLRRAEWRGHKQWPNQSTACPGEFLSLLEEVRR